MTDFYRWMEENRKQQGKLIVIFEKQIEYVANMSKRIRELEVENAALKRELEDVKNEPRQSH